MLGTGLWPIESGPSQPDPTLAGQVCHQRLVKPPSFLLQLVLPGQPALSPGRCDQRTKDPFLISGFQNPGQEWRTGRPPVKLVGPAVGRAPVQGFPLTHPLSVQGSLRTNRRTYLGAHGVSVLRGFRFPELKANMPIQVKQMVHIPQATWNVSQRSPLHSHPLPQSPMDHITKL